MRVNAIAPPKAWGKGECAGHLLQATALVHEAYARLVDCPQMRWQDRKHFLSVSAQLCGLMMPAPETARSEGHEAARLASGGDGLLPGA